MLSIFVVLSAFALERAFRDSARSAREERLLAQIYLLMAAAEVSPGGVLRIAGQSTEPRLDLPESGLYATIVNGKDVTVWQSRSALGLDLPQAIALQFLKIKKYDLTTNQAALCLSLVIIPDARLLKTNTQTF